MHQCPTCKRTFSRRDAMLRHTRNIHVEDVKRKNGDGYSQRTHTTPPHPSTIEDWMHPSTSTNSDKIHLPPPPNTEEEWYKPPPPVRHAEEEWYTPLPPQLLTNIQDGKLSTPPPLPSTERTLIPFQPCSSILIAGPTSSGKTRWLDGQSTPFEPLQPNYKGNQFLDAYHRLYWDREERVVHVNREDFKNGYCLYVFRPSGYGEDLATERAHTRLELKLSEALPDTCTVIVYAKCPALMKINASRNVTLER